MEIPKNGYGEQTLTLLFKSCTDVKVSLVIRVGIPSTARARLQLARYGRYAFCDMNLLFLQNGFLSLLEVYKKEVVSSRSNIVRSEEILNEVKCSSTKGMHM